MAAASGVDALFLAATTVQLVKSRIKTTTNKPFLLNDSALLSCWAKHPNAMTTAYSMEQVSLRHIGLGDRIHSSQWSDLVPGHLTRPRIEAHSMISPGAICRANT
jgi:hypothetical protein